MKSQHRVKSLCLIFALTLPMTAPAFAADFGATINISGTTTISVGQSTTLTATWTTTKDVTRSEWSIGATGQGPVSFEGSSAGTSTFTFNGPAVGSYTITFRIWHHSQTERDACNSVTVTVTSAIITASIDFDPDTLNLDSEGLPVTCYIQLPSSYNVANIAIGSIRLNATVPVIVKPDASFWSELQDLDEDGTNETLMVKFDRNAVKAVLTVGQAVSVTVTGTVSGTAFTGSDTIRVTE